MRRGTCKHFQGIQHGTCAAGVSYDDFREPGVSMLKTMPCMNASQNTCSSREEPSAVEIAEYEAELVKDMQIVMILDAAIKSGDKEGTVKCHCGGTIRWVHPQSLALRAKCDSCDWSAMS